MESTNDSSHFKQSLVPPQGTISPFDLPEILIRIGQFLPLWSGEGYSREFQPLPLLRCALVSRAFRQALLPTLWYVYDGFWMRNVPSNVLVKNSHYFRIISNTGLFKGPFHCKNLIELSTVYGQEWSRELLGTNPGLKRLVWGGPYFRRIETLEQQMEWQLELKALMGLENLDVLKTSGFSLGEGIFVKVLMNNAKLSNLALSTVEGVTSIDGLELPFLTELHISFSGTESPALVDLIRCCPRIQKLSLTGARTRKLTQATTTTAANNINNSQDSNNSNAEIKEFQVERLAQNIAECCPELSSIKFTSNYNTASSSAGQPLNQSFLFDHEFTSLINACRRLESFSAEMITLDYALTEAIIAHSQHLTALTLTVHDSSLHLSASDRQRELYCLRRLKSSLERLKELNLTWDRGVVTPTHSITTAEGGRVFISPQDEKIRVELQAFLSEPWGCTDLISLSLNGLALSILPDSKLMSSSSHSLFNIPAIPIIEDEDDGNEAESSPNHHETVVNCNPQSSSTTKSQKFIWKQLKQQQTSGNVNSSTYVYNSNLVDKNNGMMYHSLFPNILLLPKLRHICLDHTTFEKGSFDGH